MYLFLIDEHLQLQLLSLSSFDCKEHSNVLDKYPKSLYLDLITDLIHSDLLELDEKFYLLFRLIQNN